MEFWTICKFHYALFPNLLARGKCRLLQSRWPEINYVTPGKTQEMHLILLCLREADDLQMITMLSSSWVSALTGWTISTKHDDDVTVQSACLDTQSTVVGISSSISSTNRWELISTSVAAAAHRLAHLIHLADKTSWTFVSITWIWKQIQWWQMGSDQMKIKNDKIPGNTGKCNALAG